MRASSRPDRLRTPATRGTRRGWARAPPPPPPPPPRPAPPGKGAGLPPPPPPPPPPLPLLADRGREPQLEDRVEGLVGVAEHRPEQPVDLVGGDRGQRQAAVDVDVAVVVDGKRDAVHLQVALEQPAVDALVVLVGV